MLFLLSGFGLHKKGNRMNFYVVSDKWTPNVWPENEISTYLKDYDRDINDPLFPNFDDHHEPFCPVCHHCLRTYPLPPLRREIHLAKPYFGDIIVGGPGLYFSEHAMNLYKDAGLTGIEAFRKIEILKVVTHNGVRKGKLPPCPSYYWCDLVVDGAKMDYKKSKAVFCPPVSPLCGFCMIPLNHDAGTIDKYTGVYLEESTWNKNNIFLPLGIWSKVMADQVFKNWYDENNLTGIELRPSSSVNENYGFYENEVEEYGQEGLRYDLD